MFRISRRLDYGLHLMVELASQNSKTSQSTASLAGKLEIPLPFLHQIAHSLMQSGLIKATPGPRGGLKLNRPAEEVTVLQIVEALDGPVSLSPQLNNGAENNCHSNCPSQELWNELQHNIVQYLAGITLQALAQKRQKAEFLSLAFNSPTTTPFSN